MCEHAPYGVAEVMRTIETVMEGKISMGETINRKRVGVDRVGGMESTAR